MTKEKMAIAIVAVWRSRGQMKGLADDTMKWALVDCKTKTELTDLYHEYFPTGETNGITAVGSNLSAVCQRLS